MAKDSRETLGIGGSQDYDSAIGWEPVHMRERTARKLSEKVAADTLYCQPMNKWMQSIRAVTAEDGLFGPFWLRNELAIMFSAAGVGKSLLATQIAEHVARGFRMEPFAIDAEICRPERVLYLDFELNREQLVSRYSVTDASGTAGNHLYSFSSDIIRSEHFWNGHLAQGYESFTEMLFDEVTDVVQQFGIGTLIVDNITFLDRSSTANTDIALGIMRRLNDLKRSQFLSILVLAHAAKPTGRPGPLTETDMQGSVNLCNFADSVFALGRSVFSPELRYLKQIKSRSARIDFDAKNVPVFALGKFDLAAAMRITARDRSAIDNFLGYSFLKFADENKLSGEAQPESLIWHPEMKLKALKLVRRGKSAAKIASELGISRSTAYRYLGRRKS